MCTFNEKQYTTYAPEAKSVGSSVGEDVGEFVGLFSRHHHHAGNHRQLVHQSVRT